MELIYSRARGTGGFGSDEIEVALWDEATDRLEVLTTLSSVHGEHNNNPYMVEDSAKRNLYAGKDFDFIVERCARIRALRH